MAQITADTIAIDVVAKVEQAQRGIATYGNSVRQTMTQVSVALQRGESAAESAAAKQSAAYRGLAGELSKVAIDLSNGADAFTVLGEHGVAVAGTIEKFGGTFGRVAGYVAGPWGILLLTAASIIGQLATWAEVAENAVRKKGEAARTLTEAIDDLATSTGAANRTSEEEIAQNLKAVRSYKERERVVLASAKALLTLKMAEYEGVKAGADSGLPGSESMAALLPRYERQVNVVRKLLGDIQGELARADEELRDGEFSQAVFAIEGRLDPELAAVRDHERAMRQLRARNRKGELLPADRDAEIERLLRGKRQRETRANAAPRLSAKVVPTRPGEAKPLPPTRPMPPEDPKPTIVVPVIAAPSEDELRAEIAELVAAIGAVDVARIEAIDPAQMAVIGKISTALRDDLASGLTDAIFAGKSLGDVLVDSFARAGAALVQSQIMRLLDPSGDGSSGFVRNVANIFGNITGARRPPRRASGGHVSAGALYQVNEMGIEGFRPAGSGSIVPLGRMAAPPQGGGVTVVQPLNVSFAGAITTPELMAQFKAYADGVGQAAVMGGAAMAQAKMAKRAARALPR